MIHGHTAQIVARRGHQNPVATIVFLTSTLEVKVRANIKFWKDWCRWRSRGMYFKHHTENWWKGIMSRDISRWSEFWSIVPRWGYMNRLPTFVEEKRVIRRTRSLRSLKIIIIQLRRLSYTPALRHTPLYLTPALAPSPNIILEHLSPVRILPI